MKKKNWLMLLLFAAAAAGLRVWQDRAGFDEEGLALRGFLPGLLLPAVLIAAAVLLCLDARALPAKQSAGTLGKRFPFRSTAALACTVAGALLLCCATAASLTGHGSLGMPLAAPLGAASGLAMLYAVFSLRRSGEARGGALLVPVCALVAFMILLYRADASNPILARVYIELLAVAALTFASALLAAFAFSDGAPRAFVPVCAMAALLAVPAAVDQVLFNGAGGLAGAAVFAGGGLTAAGFLAAAVWEE